MATPEDSALLFSFFNEIGIIAQLSSVQFQRQLPDGLTLSQFGVLNWFVRVDSEATPGRLARAFQVTGGAMTNTLKKLESKGLVSIAPDAESGRKKRVTITERGLQTRAAAQQAATPLLATLAGDLDTGRMAECLPILKEVRQYLDENR